MHSKDDQSSNKNMSKWLKRLAPVAFSAGILLSQNPVSADPLVQRLIDQAMSRAALTTSRREDQEIPNSLVLKPSTGSNLHLVGHASHASHASHSSHASHASGSGSYSAPSKSTTPLRIQNKTSDYSTPTKRVNPSSKQADTKVQSAVLKTVCLKDGSELIGDVTSTKDRVSIKSAFGTFEFQPKDVQSVKVAMVNSKFLTATSGNVITLITGKRYKGEVIDDSGAVSVKTDFITTNVPKDQVKSVEKIESPTTSWIPDQSNFYWITLRDGSKVLARVSKSGEEYLLKFGYGEVHANTKDILIFKKDSKTIASSPMKAEAEAP